MRIAVFLLLNLLLCFDFYGQQPTLMLPLGHTNAVEAASFSSDGKYLLTASLDKTAKIWDATNGQLLINITGHSDLIMSAHFSPDNKKVITGSYDKTAKIWDAGNGKLVATLPGHPGILYNAFFTNNGKYIITSGFNDNSKSSFVRIWDSNTYLPVTGFMDSVFSINVKVSNSPDDNSLLVSGKDSSIYVLAIPDGTIKHILKSESYKLWGGFSPDGKQIITDCSDSTIRIWNAQTYSLVKEIHLPRKQASGSLVTPDGKMIFSNTDRTRIYETNSGKMIREFGAGIGPVSLLSQDGKIGVGVNAKPDCSWCYYTSIWDLANGKRKDSIAIEPERNALALSLDGKSLLMGSGDNTTTLYDLNQSRIIYRLKFRVRALNNIYSPAKNLLVLDSWDDFKEVWDGDRIKFLENSNRYQDPAFLSPSRNKGIFLSGVSSFVIVDLNKDSILLEKKGNDLITSTRFSHDGKKVLVGYREKKIKVFDADNGDALLTINDSLDYQYALFSSDDKRILSYSIYSANIKTWDITNGKLIAILKGHSREITNAIYSPDGKIIASGSVDKTIKIWDADNGDLLRTLQDKDMSSIRDIKFSSDGKRLLSRSKDFILRVWDVNTGRLLTQMSGHTADINGALFSADDKFIFSVSNDNTAKAWDSDTGKLLFSFFKVDTSDYVVADAYGRYDGSEAARKLLYFTCGTEVVELDQVKDQLWVPGLAERILKGDSINAKTLGDLNICGLTPRVESKQEGNIYSFNIVPRRGGLGETVVFVNGIEAGRFKKEQLLKNGESYVLKIKREELDKYFIPGSDNNVIVKAYTDDNTISSRGIKINESKTKQETIPPNLYAVMVGISDYKGDELDLKYAAKDAGDISNAVSLSAKKLLNTDGKEHVFTYNLTTAKDHYQVPEKNSIKKVLEEIGKKATANDILLIFFAGHGIMAGTSDNKQFYFLTADASTLTSTDAVKEVGISTTELTEWMKPQNIKAQKRILIFDACNSGQAIRDFVKLGTGDQNYVAARDDDKAQQIKAIDKLNEKSGLFILSASASSQSAYELGRYSQGLLTYSLLQAIKQQPDILEDGKYLNVSQWFNAAEKTVSELAKESGARQEPQIVSNTNFNIGLVDDDVLSKIVLPQEKPLFAASNFQNNDEAIADDDLELSKLINLQLNDLAARGTESKIAYVTTTNSPDAWSLSGRYEVKGNEVVVKVNIKQNKEIKQRIEIKGSKSNLKELAATIAEKAAGMVK